jgi:BTB/POZ domain
MGTEMVDLYVGPQKDRFHVHKEVLCKKIPYFEKMFKGEFKEATEDQATFPEDNPESFDLLLGWVYHNSIRPLVALREGGINSLSVNSWSIIKFYLLAEKFCLSQLQDQIFNEYLDYLHREISFPAVHQIGANYSDSPVGNPFRKFAARAFHWAIDPSSKLSNTIWPTHALAKLLQDQKDLAEDVLILIRTGVKASNPKQLPRCEFHCHDKDEPCPTKKGNKD